MNAYLYQPIENPRMLRWRRAHVMFQIIGYGKCQFICICIELDSLFNSQQSTINISSCSIVKWTIIHHYGLLQNTTLSELLYNKKPSGFIHVRLKTSTNERLYPDKLIT